MVCKREIDASSNFEQRKTRNRPLEHKFPLSQGSVKASGMGRAPDDRQAKLAFHWLRPQHLGSFARNRPCPSKQHVIGLYFETWSLWSRSRRSEDKSKSSD